MPGTTTQRAAERVARAVVVSALVAPLVVLAHLLTRGETPGLPGLAAVTGLVGLAALLAPAAGTLRTAAVVVVAQAGAHGALAALAPGSTGGGCLPAVGRGAEAGLHLAMLRTDVTCPTTLAAGPTLTALVGALLTAVVLVVAQVLVAALAARLAAAATALATAVRALLAAVLPVLPRPVRGPLPAGPAAVRRTDDSPAPRTSPAPEPLTRRGPPRPRHLVTAVLA